MTRRATTIFVCFLLLAGGVVLMLWPRTEPDPLAATGGSEPSPPPARTTLSSVVSEAVSSTATPAAAEAECPPKMTQEELEEHDARQQEHFTQVAKQLSRSDNAENVLAAALLLQGSPGNTSLEALDRAFRLDPRSPLVTWNMLRVCRDDEAADCDLDFVEASATRADGDNGAIWMEMALLRLEEGQTDAARLLVRKAIAAPRFDNYFIEHARLIERALEAGGDSTYTERMIAGIGYSAALVVSYYTITSHCRTLDPADAVWIDLCQQIGEKMLVDGRVLLDQAIGASLIKIATEHTHDAERIEAALERESSFRKRYQDVIASVESQNLLANDEAVLRQYVEHLATFGELEAMTKLAEEAARLRETAGYDQCNFTNWYLGG